ncbi:MAG: TIGR02466 family protein [Kiloniellales bacterium]
MPNLIHLFPLTVFRSSISVAPDERAHMVNAIVEMGQTRVNQKRPGVSWTGDLNGHELLHNDPRFATLFTRFERPLHDYLDLFHIDRNRVRLHFTRSWGTLSSRGDSTQSHRHVQSHISLVYYLKKPSDSSGISFLNKEAPNQFAPNLFDDAMRKAGVLKLDHQSNAQRIYVEPSEDDVLIFPSQALHEIPTNHSSDLRVSIACDIVMTVRNSAELEFLLPDPSTWRSAN